MTERSPTAMPERPSHPIPDYLLEMDAPCGRLLEHRILSVDPVSFTVRNQFTGKPEFCNPMGVIQGGLLSSMLDTALTMAGLVATEYKAFLPTLEMKSTFIGPARPGIFIGEGRVLRMGKSIIFLEATLYDAQENLIATASATAKLIYKRDREQK